MSEPAIVTYGRQFIDAFKPAEYRESLVRAFVTGGADFIVLDSFPRGQRFLSAGVAWALDAGLLRHSCDKDEGQCTVSVFRLTAKGREELGK